MVQEGEGVETEREWYMNMGAKNVRRKEKGRRGRVRSLIHLSDFILGLSLSPVFTPASHFDPSPLVCHYCVKSRLYTGFSFLLFRLVLGIVSRVYFVYIITCSARTVILVLASFIYPRLYLVYIITGSACTVSLYLLILCFFSRRPGTSKVLLGV